MSQAESESESHSSSVQSSPNAPRRFLPLHVLNTLSPSKQVIPIVSDSESDSDVESMSLPMSYYASPSKPGKRRHLSVPSPSMAQLSIAEKARRFKSSIPGYGQGTKKIIRVSGARLNRGQLSLSCGGHEEFQRSGMQSARPVSEPALETLQQEGSVAFQREGIGQSIPVSDRAFPKRLFESTGTSRALTLFGPRQPRDLGTEMIGSSPEGIPPSPSRSRFPIRRRVLLPRMKDVQLQYREARSPIVLSDSDSSEDEPSEAAGTVAISRVVSEILGREPSLDSDASLFADPGDVLPDTTRLVADDVGTVIESPGFHEKNDPKPPSKREQDRVNKKDVVSIANLTKKKIKEISKYPCCDSYCLWEFSRDDVTKHRTYYYGLTMKEKNVLLQGCMTKVHQGRTGYTVGGKSCCRRGFKKLYSIGNDRLQRLTTDIFCQRQHYRFVREKSVTQLALVQWLNNFFMINVESLPNKDIFHLPDNWTKSDVFDAFKNDFLLRDETTITYSWFCRIWNLEFPRVRIPKRSRFSTCAPCTELKALRDKATLEAERRKICFFFTCVEKCERPAFHIQGY